MCAVAEPNFIRRTAELFWILIQGTAFIMWGTIIRGSLQRLKMSSTNPDPQCCRATSLNSQGNLPRGFAGSPVVALPRPSSQARAARASKRLSNLPVRTRDAPAFYARREDFTVSHAGHSL